MDTMLFSLAAFIDKTVLSYSLQGFDFMYKYILMV